MARKTQNKRKGNGQYLPADTEGTKVMLDPRQTLFLAYYLDPKSKTFSNAKQSAIAAGYEESYAKNIMDNMPEWLREKVEKYRSDSMLEKAERNLVEMMELPSKTQAMGAFGPIFEKRGKKKIPVMTYATGLLKIKNDASKFVAEKVGRGKYGGDEDALPKGATVANFIQINIHAPGKRKTGGSDAGHISERETISRVAGA